MREFSMKDKIGYTLGDLGCCCTEQFRAMFFDRILHARTESKSFTCRNDSVDH